MKVLDLQCAQAHVFEGWFASEDDYQDQRRRGLVQCPFCGDAELDKRLSAPRLNLGARPPATAQPVLQHDVVATGGAGEPASLHPAAAALQAAWLEWSRRVVAQTEDVGQAFAREARRMHHGEAEERPIRGHATASEAAALLDEGIAVLPLALPAAAKETLQ